MSGPGSRVEPGFFMVFSVRDFGPPPRETEEPDPVYVEQVPDVHVPKQRKDEVSTVSKPPETAQCFSRPKNFMDHEYPEWVDDLPPWRNPDPKGDPYLFVWEQHQARIRGHH